MHPNGRADVAEADLQGDGGVSPAPAPSPASADAGGRMPAARAWGAVALLTLVGVLNYVDRFLPAVLAEPIKRELLLSDTALGLINGFGFLVIYAVIGIPIARLADSGRYGLVISASLGLWSVMTMLGGLAQSGWQLAMTRMGVAVGEAGSTPAAHAFVARNFAPDRRAAPLAVLTLSVPLATMAGLMGGGLVGEALGWRKTFLVMGGVSLLFAPLILLVLGPGSRTSKPASPTRSTPLRSQLALLRKRSFLAILAGSAFVGMGGYAMTAFAPAYLMRVHGLSVSQVGTQYGVASGLLGIVGLMVTGAVADRLSSKEPRWLLWVVAAMIVLLLPCALAGLTVEDGTTALWLIAAAYVVGTAYMAPVVAAIQRVAPPEHRATASAIFLFSSAMLGGLGPLVTGMISDALQPRLGAEALGRALLVTPAAYAVAALLYLLAAQLLRKDLVDEASEHHPRSNAHGR